MGFLGFMFCWFLVGALTAGCAMWLTRNERDAPTKILAWCVILGFISPCIMVIAVVCYFFDQHEDIKNPFYKEPKKEK